MADQADTSNHNDGGLLHAAYDYITSKFAHTPLPKPAYSSPGLGTGIVAAGANAISGRQAQLDKALADSGG